MESKTFSLSWLSDPTVFAVNRLPAVSDHEFYASEAEAAEEDHASMIRKLDGVWKAHFAMNPDAAADFLLTDNAHDGDLMDIQVPGEFQLQNPDWNPAHYVNTMYPTDGWEELYPPEVSLKHNPTVTAVTCFHISPDELKSPRIVLTFGGVEPSCAVWLNGAFVGYSEDSFTPHAFDVTALVKEGENRLAVRVFKRCTGNWIESQDFWRFSGIHRSVTLTFERKSHLEDVFVHTPLSEQYTKARVEAELKLLRPCGTVRFTLIDPDGAKVAEQTAPAQEQLTLGCDVEHPRLWSAEQPFLYRLEIALLDTDGSLIELSRVAVGIREFRIINRIMCLNGRRIVFHGVNRHEFDCDTGRVMSRAVMERDVRDIKSLNMNAIRTCHYPNDPYLYRLCDRYGLYVIDEANIESHGSWAHPAIDGRWNIPGDRPDWMAVTLDRGRSMLERDKNHACILLWSCGNESFGGRDLLALHDWFTQRDPSRVVHYEGVQNDHRDMDITDVETHMYARVADIEAYLNNDPPKPFINCEYTHAMGNSCGGMSLYTELEDKYPMYQGGFIWDYVDQGLRTTAPNGAERFAYGGDFGDRPTDYHFNTNGIELADRTRTPKCQEVQYLFREADVLPSADGVTVRSRRVFADLSDCMLSTHLYQDGRLVASSASLVPPVAPGESVKIDIPWKVPQEGEVTIISRLVLKADEGIRSKGHAVAWGQCVLGSYRTESHEPAPAVLCDYNVGLHTGKAEAIFGSKYLGMISLRDAEGKECLLHAPRLSLFRAPTDNDMGNGDDIRDGVWTALSLRSAITVPEITGAADAACLTYRFSSPVLPGVEIPVSYGFFQDAVKVTVKWPGVQGQSTLPALGMSFQLDKRLHHVKYYGLGPDENYIDRREGALLGNWEYEVEEGWTRYAKPQESGNRTGVRRMTVTDDTGHGVMVEMDETPLEISVQPWLAEELSSKWHPEELQGSCKTVLDVAMFRKGIGGDDSWGAPVLPQFTYPSDRPYEFSFWIKGV